MPTTSSVQRNECGWRCCDSAEDWTSGGVNWGKIDLEKDDHDHLVSPEERFRIAIGGSWGWGRESRKEGRGLSSSE